MRRLTVLLLLLALVLLAFAYRYGGIKLGILTLMPTRMWNVEGQSAYSYLNTGGGVVVSGSCSTSSGLAVLRLLTLDGTQVAGQQCPKGDWLINLEGKGTATTFRLTVDYTAYTGTLDVKVAR